MLIERPLSGFSPIAEQPRDAFILNNKQGFEWSIALTTSAVIKITVTGPSHPAPPNSNVTLTSEPLAIKTVVDHKACNAMIQASGLRHLVFVGWEDTPVVEVYEDGPVHLLRIFGDTPHKSYCVSDAGITRYTRFENHNLHVGLGEKAAPLDLSHRSFSISGTDAASYDAFMSDPLYKHTPFLMSLPKPFTPEGQPQQLTSVVGIYSASNSDANWDVGRFIDEPWTTFKKYQQDWGGLEEYIILGENAQQVVRQFSDLVGRPLLVPRDWLGYLASGMGLGEMDDPPAQELLSAWPTMCKTNDIPCSAIHLSSGYTVDEHGNRLVFTMNKKRYPDFAAMVRIFHANGIRVTPNIKPYVLQVHPDYKRLYDAGALFTDAQTGEPVVTRIWSSLPGVNAKGSWVDFTSKAGRKWWRDGVSSLCDLGVDSVWNDNNQHNLLDDTFICKNELCGEATADGSRSGESACIGLVGRMTNTELMAKESRDALASRYPDRRPFVLTRSANVGTLKYAASTWSGDNRTSWHNLRGSIAMNLNAQLSLMQSYGNDIGGFAGPLPSPELFVRWVQSGVTQPRFCIHSFKPSKDDPTGTKLNNLPWMYPQVVDIIRSEIKRRYELIPWLNNLNWRSHLHSEPMNTWLGWGEFAADPEVYTKSVLEGFDYWAGHGQLLVAGSYFEGQLSRRVYLPRASADDKKVYYNIHAPYEEYTSGVWVENVATPLEHSAMFAREGTVLPIGKSKVTLTQREGIATVTCDGTRILTEEEGGLATYDDWRAVEIFPSSPLLALGETYTYTWVEDDGVSTNPEKAEIQVTFSSTKTEVSVEATVRVSGFKPLWISKLWVILPVGDTRTVEGATEQSAWKTRTAHAISVTQT